MTDEAMSEMSARRRFDLGGVPAQFGLVIIMAAFWAVFAWRAPGFLSPFNLFSVGRALAVDTVIGFAQMAALATGGMNLSVGSIGVCAVMTSGYLMQTLALPIPVAILGALALGAALGWLNGFVIARSGVSAFIITLASANLFSGAMLILTRAVPLNNLPAEVGAFGKAKIAGLVSPLLVVALVIGLLLFVFYRHSVLGRQILAAGANARAAKMSGVPVDRVITISHALSGLLAATAGMMDAPEFREPLIHLWLGRDAHLVHYPVKGGKLINVVVITADDWSGPGWSEPASRVDLLARLSSRRWAPQAHSVFRAPDAWLKWALYEIEPLWSFAKGAAALLGDAAHAMLPFLAQGAAMAIEDAAVAAQCLARMPDDPGSAWESYSAIRRSRTRKVQRLAARNGKRYHRAAAAAMLRDTAMRLLGSERLLQNYDWLYDWRPPAGLSIT